jgi:hypothetical protein
LHSASATSIVLSPAKPALPSKDGWAEAEQKASFAASVSPREGAPPDGETVNLIYTAYNQVLGTGSLSGGNRHFHHHIVACLRLRREDHRGLRRRLELLGEHIEYSEPESEMYPQLRMKEKSQFSLSVETADRNGCLRWFQIWNQPFLKLIYFGGYH